MSLPTAANVKCLILCTHKKAKPKISKALQPMSQAPQIPFKKFKKTLKTLYYEEATFSHVNARRLRSAC